jgi:hypothetical protein
MLELHFACRNAFVESLKSEPLLCLGQLGPGGLAFLPRSIAFALLLTLESLLILSLGEVHEFAYWDQDDQEGALLLLMESGACCFSIFWNMCCTCEVFYTSENDSLRIIL